MTDALAKLDLRADSGEGERYFEGKPNSIPG